MEAKHLLFFALVILSSSYAEDCPQLYHHVTELAKAYVAPEAEDLFQQFQYNCGPYFASDDPDQIRDSAQVAVYRNECLIFNALCHDQGATMDHRLHLETLFPTFESAHSLMVLGLLHQQQRGYFQWNETISSYWPAFGANGKSDITFDDFISSSSGLTHFDNTRGLETVFPGTGNRSAIEALIVNQVPSWERGSFYQSPYQAWGLFAASISKYVDPQERYLDQYILEEIVDYDNETKVSFGLQTIQEWLDNPIRVVSAPRPKRNDVFRFWYDQQIEASCSYSAVFPDFSCMTDTYKTFEIFVNTARESIEAHSTGPIGMSSFGQPSIFSPLYSTFATAKSYAKLAQHLAFTENSFLSNENFERIRSPRYHGYDPLSYEDLHITGGGFRLGSERYQIPNGTFASISLFGSFVLVDPERKMSIAYLSARSSDGTTQSAMTYNARSIINVALGLESPTVPETDESTEPATTEPATTGSATTGVATTGVATTGSATTGYVVTGCSQNYQCPAQPRDFCDIDRCSCRYGFDGFNCSCPDGFISWITPLEPFCLHSDECIQSSDCASGYICAIDGESDVGLCEIQPTDVATTGVPALPCSGDWECPAQPNATCNVQGECECHYGFEGDGSTCTCSSDLVVWEGPTGQQQPYCLHGSECTQTWQCPIPLVCHVSSGLVIGYCA